MNLLKSKHLNIELSKNGCTSILALKGHFLAASFFEWQKHCKHCLEDSTVNRIIVDLSGVESIDSSSLGFLLELREKSQATEKSLILSSISKVVHKKFVFANFNTLFTITIA